MEGYITAEMNALSMNEDKVEVLTRSHPILSIAVGKEGSNLKISYGLREFVTKHLHCNLRRIPYTLTQFYIIYVDYLLSRFSRKKKLQPGRFRDTVEGLSRLAFDNLVKDTKITNSSMCKMFGIELKGQGDIGLDVEDVALGFLEPLETKKSKKKTYRFKETSVQEFFTAKYQIDDCVRKNLGGSSNTVTSSMRESLRKLPVTADMWRITFGLLCLNEDTIDIQRVLLKHLVEEAKRLALPSFDITSLCVESVYESQNAGELTDLLDDFTMNQTIHYSNVRVEPSRMLYCISAVGYLVRASPEVYGLHMSNFNLTESNLRLITDPINAISDNNLQVLNLSCNAFGVNGIRRLQRFLVKASLLTHLDLSSCDIGNTGLALLSEYFMCMPLRYLKLSSNNIGDSGLLRALPNMKYIPTLEWLELDGNHITDKSAVALGKALKAMPNLRSLDLRQNSIGDDGADGVSRGLTRLKKLSQLVLADNKIGEQGASALAGHCWRTKSLRYINVSLNNIPREGILGLRQAALSHGSLQILAMGQSPNSTFSCDSSVLSSDDYVISKEDRLSLNVDLSAGRRSVSSTMDLRTRSRKPEDDHRRSWHGLNLRDAGRSSKKSAVRSPSVRSSTGDITKGTLRPAGIFNGTRLGKRLQRAKSMDSSHAW